MHEQLSFEIASDRVASPPSRRVTGGEGDAQTDQEPRSGGLSVALYQLCFHTSHGLLALALTDDLIAVGICRDLDEATTEDHLPHLTYQREPRLAALVERWALDHQLELLDEVEA